MLSDADPEFVIDPTFSKFLNQKSGGRERRADFRSISGPKQLMGPSDGGGASAGYLVPTPVDYDSEEDRERNGWEWEAPSDTAASNHDCGLHEESLPAESGRRKAHVNEAAENDSTLGAEFQSDKAVIVEGYRPFSLENSCPVLVQAVPSR